jgi:UDPglucose 6-dehydrogenase
LADTVRAKVVVDGRNCLDAERWSAAGWHVYCLGKSPRAVSPPSLV